jgi:hypothetical protein
VAAWNTSDGPRRADEANVNGFESPAPASPRRGLYARLARWLTAEHADRVIVALGVLLLLPSLPTGLAADDYLYTVMLDRPTPMPGFQRSPLDIFRFCDPHDFPSLFRRGIFSWWDDPSTRLVFMRPLTAATHAFDHLLFRNQGWEMHLHSVLWALLLFLGVRALYRELFADRLVANLALALYALDDTRGWLVSWVAARNAAIATALSVWALVAHHATRRGRLPRHWFAGPIVFTLALLAGEGSAATLGYLLGYALFLERGSLRHKAATLLPYVLVFVGWRVVYRALGYGVSNSSLYADPLIQPGLYLEYLVQHATVLLAAQLGVIWADITMLSFAVPRGQWLAIAAFVMLIAWFLWLLRPQLRAAAEARFACLGMLCAVLAVAPANPAMDRLLTWIAIGACPLVAMLIAPALRGASGIGRARSITVAALLLINAAGVLLLPTRARGNLVSRSSIERAQAAVPTDPEVADRTLIFMNPPLLVYAGYSPIERAALGVPSPRAQHVLAVSATEVAVERVDANTLRLRPRLGFIIEPTSKMLWNARRHFHAGDRIQQRDMLVTVLDVTPDARPSAIEARFARPLEDPSYLWIQWLGARTERFVPPPIGERMTLPAVDYIQAVLGFKLPFGLRL